MRSNGRAPHDLRQVKITRNFTKHAEGSVLIEFGDTKVLCTASVINSVPKFLKGTGQGWVTAEYGMLPRSTHDRMDRESVQGKQSGRTQEIQRLIGRSLRTALDLKALGENTITIDCDVIQADGGTRTAAITGGCIALADAIKKLPLPQSPFKRWIASTSVGICKGIPLLDLDYLEDSCAETDMNVVMNNEMQFIEIQGTAEKSPFDAKQLQQMLDLASGGIRQLFELQQAAMK